MGGARQDEGPVCGRSRPCAGEGPNEAARRVPRDRRAARARERPRPPGARAIECAGRAARRPAAPLVHSTKRSPRHALDLQEVLTVRQAGTPTLTPYTGGKALLGGRQWLLADRAGGQRALPDRSSRGTRSNSGSSRHPRRNACCAGSMPTTGRFCERSTGSIVLDGQGVAGYKAALPYVRSARTDRRPTVDLGHKSRLPDERRDAGARRRRIAAPTLRRETSSGRRERGERRARARARPRSLLVADRPDPANRGAALTDRGRRLLGTARCAEPRRARFARRKCEPDERRAAAAVRRAGDREQAQERVPRQHVARAADAAERDHRLLAGAAPAALRRGQREAGGVPRRHPLVGQPPARR